MQVPVLIHVHLDNIMIKGDVKNALMHSRAAQNVHHLHLVKNVKQVLISEFFYNLFKYILKNKD